MKSLTQGNTATLQLIWEWNPDWTSASSVFHLLRHNLACLPVKTEVEGAEIDLFEVNGNFFSISVGARVDLKNQKITTSPPIFPFT